MENETISKITQYAIKFTTDAAKWQANLYVTILQDRGNLQSV